LSKTELEFSSGLELGIKYNSDPEETYNHAKEAFEQSSGDFSGKNITKLMNRELLPIKTMIAMTEDTMGGYHRPNHSIITNNYGSFCYTTCWVSKKGKIQSFTTRPQFHGAVEHLTHVGHELAHVKNAVDRWRNPEISIDRRLTLDIYAAGKEILAELHKIGVDYTISSILPENSIWKKRYLVDISNICLRSIMARIEEKSRQSGGVFDAGIFRSEAMDFLGKSEKDLVNYYLPDIKSGRTLTPYVPQMIIVDTIKNLEIQNESHTEMAISIGKIFQLLSRAGNMPVSEMQKILMDLSVLPREELLSLAPNLLNDLYHRIRYGPPDETLSAIP